jgi:hypothetical protein
VRDYAIANTTNIKGRIKNGTEKNTWDASRKELDLKMVRAPQAQAMLPTKPTGKINWGDIDVAQLDLVPVIHVIYVLRMAIITKNMTSHSIR